MLAIGIRYLNGWAMAAADGAKKERAEWPPHPDRVFMSLAAAWFETGEVEEEGEALRWLEALDSPAIRAPDATFRDSVVSYVPVNDRVPEHRSPQPRRFPTAIPHAAEGCLPEVYLIWNQVGPGVHLPALEKLTAKVTHIGHSASLVQAWVETERQLKPTWVPIEGVAKHRLKTPYKGRLDNLANSLNRDQYIEYKDLKAACANASKTSEKRRLKKEIDDRFNGVPPRNQRPSPGRWQSYDSPEEQTDSSLQGSLFNPQLIIMRLTGKRLSLPATLILTKAFRNLLLNSCPVQPPPEWLSGHQQTGKPSIEPHLAIFPLAFVGNERADGRIIGVGLALPREYEAKALTDSEIGRCFFEFLHDSETGLIRRHKLFDGKWFECMTELEARESPPRALQPDRWTRPSRVWASVTPVALNRHFRGNNSWEQTAESMKDACEHIGLPRPREVLLHPVSLIEGAPHVRDFPRIERKNQGGKPVHQHLVATFDEPIRGPILIGAGRFRGYGVCLPMDKQQ